MENERKAEIRQVRPLIFGEVLFDAFPDGSLILGGAPFNVAWHLQGLGLRPLFISRVGTDDAGKRVRAAMRDWGMDASGLQYDDERSTGRVSVNLERGQPAFEILPAQAYDRIDADAALDAVDGEEIGLIYHGTLALRDPPSRAALHALHENLRVPRCVDLNLRAPWWNETVLASALCGAHWVKISDAELRAIAGIGDDSSLREQARRLHRQHDIAALIVTLGERGALIVTPDELIESPAAPIDRFVDAVGAGDAFAAVALVGMARGWPMVRTLTRALEFAAWICGVRGATAADRERYAGYRRAWGLETGDAC